MENGAVALGAGASDQESCSADVNLGVAVCGALASAGLQRHVKSWRTEAAWLRVVMRQSWESSRDEFRRFWHGQEASVRTAMILTPLQDLPSSAFGPFLPVACPELLDLDSLITTIEKDDRSEPDLGGGDCDGGGNNGGGGDGGGDAGRGKETREDAKKKTMSRLIALMETVASGKENLAPAFDAEALQTGLAPLLSATDKLKATKDTLLLVRSCLLLNFCNDILLLWTEAAKDPSILVVDDEGDDDGDADDEDAQEEEAGLGI